MAAAARSTVVRQARSLSFGRTEYAGRRTVTLLPGDGVGSELATSVKSVFAAVGAPVDFEEITLTTKNVKDAVVSLQRNGVGLKGVTTTPVGRNSATSVNVQLRLQLDLFANVVTVKSLPNITARHSNVDFVVVRQNTEGEYSLLEHEITAGVVESLKVITKERSLQIAKFAFDYAVQNNRKKVTAVHKANIMKQGDGLFLESCRQVAQLYPQIAFEGMIVDNTAMQLVGKPQQFDVLVTPNLYGNICANIGAGLIGGAGLVPGYNVGEKFALFETGARHAASAIAGANKANPTGLLLASASLLKHLGFTHHAASVHAAVHAVYADTKVRTADLGGSASSSEFTAAVIKGLQDPAVFAAKA